MFPAKSKKLNYYTSDEEEDDEDYYDRKYGRYSPPSKVPKDKFKPKRNIHDMQLQRFELFKAQDVETGLFDVAFEIDGKKIHAHKLMLICSEPLTSMLSDRWCNKDAEAVKIEAYSYENFYQFLCFLYSGQCDLTQENAFLLADMSEFYGIPTLKGYCDEWLSKRKEVINEKNVYELVEFAQRYSLEAFLETIEKIFNRNLDIFLGDDLFLSVKKDIVAALSKFHRKNAYDGKEEKFFEAVCKWGEHQATVKQSAAENNDNGTQAGGNLQEAIKAELTGILSNINYREMDLEYVIQFIENGKDYLFSVAELYKILLSFDRKYSKEEDFFKVVYQIAEKEALKKQEASAEEIFDLTAAIKTELAPILPKLKFHEMSDKFLTKFVVAKGILSRDAGMHVHDITVEIRNAGKILTGTFKDDFNIFDGVKIARNGYSKVLQKSKTKQRFFNLKYPIPETPSTVQKMKGAEWYLCLDDLGIVNVKFHTMVSASDYLIAELKSGNSNFEITPGVHTLLSATRNKMF
uniref:BTB domain-containing protein n=1 Tax=Panagrolaimus davidi TaxID=227884 RepID=A0A914QL42_9BILA